MGEAATVEDVTYSYSGDYVYGGTSCEDGPSGSLYAAMEGFLSHPYGSGTWVTFTAPTGLTIAGFTVWRYEADGPDQVDGAPVSNLDYSPGPPSVQGLCAQSLGCGSRGTLYEPLSPENMVSVPNIGKATQIQWSAVCGGGEGGTCPASGAGTLSSQYDLFAADVELDDGTPPSVSNVSGPLVAGGSLAGEQSVSFSASDGQSGVYAGELVVDGHILVSHPLDSNEGHCDALGRAGDGQRTFAYVQPCAPSLSAALTLDTSQLTPGAHSLELIVEDAAGNQTVAYDGTITIAASAATATSNDAIGPGSPLALRGATNGVDASDQAHLTARWRSTTNTTLTTRYDTHARAAGRLTTITGQPISGAVLDVYETPAYQGAHSQRLTVARTGTSGEWTLTLPPGVPSSTLTIDYHSHVDDTVPVATAALKLGVRAAITLHISPRVTSVGHTIHFSGTLHGEPIPPGGKQLVLEASSGGEWIQFDTLTTSTHGHFHASYRFRFPGPVRYEFRVLAHDEADFPFLQGTSNRVTIYER
jgi:hypothetical protein